MAKKPNVSKKAARSQETGRAGKATKLGEAAKPVLLSGGNPQIAKGYGDAPCRPTSPPCRAGKATSAAASIRSSSAPSPACERRSNGTRPSMASRTRQGWFLSLHVFTKYMKMTFFRGLSLSPVPPGPSKHKDVRYLDIYEGKFDEAQFVEWVKQASQLPGERL